MAISLVCDECGCVCGIASRENTLEGLNKLIEEGKEVGWNISGDYAKCDDCIDEDDCDIDEDEDFDDDEE